MTKTTPYRQYDSAVLEQQTRKLEQLSGKLDAESASRYAQVREALNAQDVKNKADRDELRSEIKRQMDSLDVVIGNILLRMEEIEKRPKASDKK